MIRFIFFLVAFLLMIAAVVGGLYFWGVDPLAKLGLVPAKGQPAELPKPAVVEVSYVDFGVLTVPIIRDHEAQGEAEMVLRLRVGAGDKEAVAQQIPRLQAYFLEDMMAFLPVSLNATRHLDNTAIRRRLLSDSERVLGVGKVTDVVIENADLR